MKNIFSKTTEKRTQNGLITDSKRTNYGISILLFAFLTLGFGQAWGAITFSGGYVYFDNTNTNWSNVIELVAHQYDNKDYIGATTMSKISGTNNLYYCFNPQGSNWDNIWGWRLMCNSSAWGNSDNSDNSVKNYATNYTATTNYGLNSGSYYLCYGASSSKGCALTTSYLGNSNSYTALNYTQTLNQYVSTDGGSTYSASTAKIGTISIATKYLSGASTTANHNASIATGYSSTNTTAARTATVTMTIADVADGYSFQGWYSAASGGTKLGSADTYTYQASAATSVYARFIKEATYDITVANSVNATRSTVKVGSSAIVISAPEIAGYSFSNWSTMPSGVTITSGSVSTATISITATKAATITANYTEDRTSRWHLVGQNDTGNEIFPDGWAVSSTSMMQKASGHTTEDIVYYSVDVATAGGRTYVFKIVDDNGTGDDIWYGYSTGDTYLEWTNTSTQNVYSGSGNSNNLKFTPTIVGTYEFKVDYSGTYPAVTITYPEVYAISGSFNSWTESNNLAFSGNDGSYSVSIDGSATNYQFKVLDNGSWYGHTNKTFTGTESNVTLSTPNNNINLKADVYPSGSYTFAYNKSTKKLGVTYPTSYIVYYAVGATKGQSTAPWANFTGAIGDKDIASGTKIAGGTTIHLYAANAKEHYTFYGWYTEDNPDRDDFSKRVSTSQHYSTSVTTTKSYYAIYFEDPYWVNTYVNGLGTITPAEGQNAYIATPSGNFTAEPGIGYKFDSWEQRSGALTIESPTNATTNVNATAASELQANFSPRYAIRVKTVGGDWSLESVNHLTGYTTVSSKDVGYSTITLAANTNYEIKVYDRQTNTWYGGSEDQNIAYGSSGSGNEYIIATTSSGHSVYVQTAAAGDYTFNWNLTDKKIAVQYPTSWFITSGQKTEGQDDNAGGSFTAVDNSSNDVKGGKFVADNASVTFTATPNTGYTFDGWYTDEACTEGKTMTNPMTVSSITANKTIYAKFLPKTYSVTLTREGEGYGSGGDASVTATFNAALPSATMPTAKNGWAFMGFYSAEDGGGRRFIDPSGNWVTSAGDTISGGHWVKPEGITLYAYYKKAEITNLTFDAAVVAPGTEVGVTPTVAPTPEGTNSICWKLLYNNGNLYDPQPNFGNPRDIANKVTFTAPGTSGMYLVAAVLRTGNDCNGGTKLDSVTYPFQVAGDHTVTVQYKCGSEVIAPSTTVTGKPLEWTEVVAHDIFGYYFSGWTAGDGVTIEEAASGRLAELQAKDASIVAVIKMKAIYDGKLTANYSKRDYIYFKSTALGWNDVYVYFYTDGGYWAEDKGAGATGAACIGKGQMSLVPGETDIYYWDYSGITGGAAAATKHVAFTNKNKMDQANFRDCEVVYPTKGNNEGFSTGTPMFVPISQTKVTYNSCADYYNKGYWTKYAGGTGYSVDIFFSKGGSYDKSIWFEEGETAGMPFTATAYLSGSTTLGFKIHRSSGLYYYSSTDVTMSNASTAKSLTYDDTSAKQTGITTNVTGEYTFTLTCGSDGKLNVTVKYPAAAGDYRLVYSDGVQTKPLVSDVVPQVNGGKDTVSFFVRPENEPVLKIQRASVSAGVLSWSDYSDISLSVSGLEEIGVYNICLQMDGSGAISVENVEAYTGEFYIRTDAANNKWDNYRAPDHLMTYSEYSKDHSDYTHYFVKFVSEGTNVKFVVANDYSPCISDTLIRQTYRGGDSDHVDEFGFLNSDLPGDGANVRYMWDIRNNAVYRAYLAPAQSDGSKFLVLRGTDDDNLKDENGNALRNASNSGQAGYNHKAPDHCIQFVDDENWIYEATVQVVPSSYVKLYAFFHDDYFYYKGTEDDTFEDSHAIKLVEGSGDAVKVRVIYDFKTDRLVAAYLPSGDINEELAIHADVMFIREHQGDIDQLTFSEKDSKMGSITNIETAYAVMRFNKWTLNDKDKNTHEVLDNPKSIYERSLYYVSFPFPVNLNEVFGFGTYGQHWIIQRYRGDLRAQQGYWAESAGFWEFIWNRNGEVLQPNQGYILTLETELLGEESDVWGPDSRSSQIELFFPSTGNLGSITSSSITQTLPEHTCTINRHVTEGLPDTGDPRTSYNRTVFDSHWNIMSVPTYINVNNPSFANTTWISDGTTNVGPKFLYTWNPDDNTLTATSGKGFMYHAMHAYTVQYYGNVTWTTSVTPSAAPQRNTEYRGEYEFCLEVQQDEQMIDRTFVRLSDDENVTTGFEFGEDMTKQFNSRKANIFTIADNTSLGGNSLPLSTTQTTVVPVGVSVKNAGDYTFAIPEGTEGIGVTLVDNETGVRTSLSALSYTVTLQPGDYTGRFVLEISPIAQTPTGVETVTGEGLPVTGARKVMIDGILYIVKDGKMYDARGARVE